MLLDISLVSRQSSARATANGDDLRCRKGDGEMTSHSKQRVFIPVMLVGSLFFGSVAAEAGQRRDDRAAKGAIIGATLGTLLQLAQGQNEGRDLLEGAIVGGALGAAAGAASSRDSYYYDRDYGYRDGYYRGGYGDGYYRDSRRYDRDRRYDRNRRYDRRSHRHDDNCRH